MCIPDGFGCDTQLRLGQEREGETIRRWCRRYLRIGRCDERYLHFHFHQSFGQRPNSLALPRQPAFNGEASFRRKPWMLGNSPKFICVGRSKCLRGLETHSSPRKIGVEAPAVVGEVTLHVSSRDTSADLGRVPTPKYNGHRRVERRILVS
jgi:hypothetical protein